MTEGHRVSYFLSGWPFSLALFVYFVKSHLAYTVPVSLFIIIGLADQFLPRQGIAGWLGCGSGLKGILIASGVGMLIPGGPFVSFPPVAALYRGGAGVGPGVAFLVAWSLWSLSRLPMEFSILGPQLMMARIISTTFFPPLAGLIADFLFER